MKVAIFGKYIQPEFLSYFKKIIKILRKHNIAIVLYQKLQENIFVNYNYLPKIEGTFIQHTEIKDTVDMLFSIGGDGTFLDSTRIVQNANIPIVGINSGRLGFLANISQDEIATALEDILRKNYVIDKRDLLHLVHPESVFPKFSCALNDITVSKKDTSTMVKIHVSLDDEFLNSYWGDGLIISTPTGSTAYSLSVGGAIVFPENDSFILSPKSPHTLTVRPIVIPNSKTITLELESRDKELVVSLDSQYASIKSGTKVVIKKADFQVKIVNTPRFSFYKTLRNKLMWGLDKRN